MSPFLWSIFLLFFVKGLAAVRLSQKAARRVRPRVTFMFLAKDRIQRPDIWQRFFRNADPQKYRIVLHCVTVDSCQAQIRNSGMSMLFNPPYIIKNPVPTKYCTDLVSAENLLLETALKLAGHQKPASASFSLLSRQNPQWSSARPSSLDKFVFLSDSTLPTKPFNEVYAKLTSKPDSRFCVFPQQEWARAPREPCLDLNPSCPEWSRKNECRKNPLYMHYQCQKSCEICTDLALLGTHNYAYTQHVVAPKVHQWKTLNLEDAKRAVELWHKGYLRHLMSSLRLNSHDTYGNTGCLDEYWHFSALYGTFPEECMGMSDYHERCAEWAAAGECQRNPMFMQPQCKASCSNCGIPWSKFSGGASFVFSLTKGAGVQGQCDTFVKWNIPGVMGSNNDMTKLNSTMHYVSNRQATGTGRPETIVSVAPKALHALRDANFLFARKFQANFEVTDSCEPSANSWTRLVLGQEVDVRESWIGAGFWYDSQKNRVSIYSDLDRERGVVIENRYQNEWNAKGTWCGDTLKVVFFNGIKSDAKLDPSDSSTLTFKNGAVWTRDVPWPGDGTWRDTYNNLAIIRTSGAKFIEIQETNPEYNARATMQVANDHRFYARFNKVIEGKHFELWGDLSEDGRQIQWHNGQKWHRDPSYSPPCVCEPDHPTWHLDLKKRPNGKEANAECFFINIGSGAGTADLSDFLNGNLETGFFKPSQCKSLFAEADAQYDGALKQLQVQYTSALDTLTSTAMYSCEPPRDVRAAFVDGKLKHAGDRPGASQVKTVNLMRILSERALRKDHVVVKIDAGGAEWDILPCLARSSAARLVDVLYVRNSDPRMGSFGTRKDETAPVLDSLRKVGINVVEIGPDQE